MSDQKLSPIVVYIIDRHPLEIPETGPSFRWLHMDNDFKRELEGLIGPYDADHLSEVGGATDDAILDAEETYDETYDANMRRDTRLARDGNHLTPTRDGRE